jgi:hypothetical protein
MISKFSIIRCLLCFFLIANNVFAGEIRLVFENETSLNLSAELIKDGLLLDSANIIAHNGKVLVLESSLKAIHQVSFDKKRSFYIYIKDKADLEVKVDLENGKFEVINSLESQQLNRIFDNWQREVAILKTLNEPTFEHFDRAFDALASEIMATQNPEIIDWASVFLVDLEKEPKNYMLSLEKFIDFEQLVREKYLSYKFINMKANFGLRKDNQSGYYWKY